MAAVLAYALHPLVEKLNDRRIPRWFGAGVAIAALMLVLLAVVLLIVPVITKQIPLFKEQVPALLERVIDGLVPLAARFASICRSTWRRCATGSRTLVTGHEQELINGLLSLAAHRRQRAGGGVRQPGADAHRCLLPAAGLVGSGRAQQTADPPALAALGAELPR